MERTKGMGVDREVSAVWAARSTAGLALRHRNPVGASTIRSGHPVAEQTWHVQLMGRLSVGRTERWWDGARMGSRRARKLVALLAIDLERWVPLDHIVETLWPTAAPRQPAANVATLVSRLRATFDTGIIAGSRWGYRLGERVGTDLDTAAGLVADAEAHLAAGRFRAVPAAAERALELTHDDVLPELADEAWATPARALRLRLRRRAWHQSAEAALRSGDHRSAIAAAEAATTAEPLDEEACRLAMHAAARLGQPAFALLAYDRLRVALANDLGVDPAEPTQALYLAILRGQGQLPR